MSWIVRAIIVLLAAILLAFQVIRTAVVGDLSSRRTIAPRLWPSHPSVMIERTMAEIGALAARGDDLPPSTLRAVEGIARRAPLAPEPFLIKGALAQMEGQPSRAERLFTAARARDPRSQAARYFLADRYLRTGRTEQALVEMGALSRLLPSAAAQFAPALAAYARMPGAVPQLRRFFHSSPEFEPVILSQLASNAHNTELILALWGRRDGMREGQPIEWQTKLVTKLIEQEQFGKAYQTWQLIAGVEDSRATLFNTGFARIPAPPPFNWTFSSAGGVVEPAPGGRLQVIYYGRNDAVLAEQLMLLAPGKYRLGMTISGPLGEGGEIAWTISCLPQTEPIFRLPVDRKGSLAGSFTIPQGCSAQRLQLTGLAGEFPRSQEFAVGRLSLTKASGV